MGARKILRALFALHFFSLNRVVYHVFDEGHQKLCAPADP